MFKFRGALLLLASAVAAAGQPALTTIRDILYRADGMRFSGRVSIVWNSFEAGDTSNIATANVTLPIVNGVLNVRLAPTTTASAGAQYNITYNSLGRNQFTEVWAVPPSTVPLRVRDVRVATGTVVGPATVTTQVQITDVAGLPNELAVRPMRGAGFSIGRAALINQSGQIDGATGNLGDCVRVDGSSGPCGSGGGGVLPSFSGGETPAGVINGSNLVFTLLFAPSPASSLDLFRNGLLMKQGADYSVSGSTITFFLASTPQAGDLLTAAYRYANPNNILGTLTSTQVICSSGGLSTTSTASAQLGSCTIPAGLLTAGDRIEVQFQYAHGGTSTGFTAEIRWGATTVISRTSVGGAALVGRMAFGIFPGGQAWDTQTWGDSLSLIPAAGSVNEDTNQNLVISFRGQMAGATSDNLVLRNFTVTRSPAQTNP